MAGTATAYVAAQPSIIRRALQAIPELKAHHFIDFGCGKGRPLMIASEMGCRAVTGIEYSPTLVKIARQNARIFARRAPHSTPITVVQADATAYELPKESVVLFFYNPFAETTMRKVIANIEASLAASPRPLFVVAYNPVAAPLLDGSPALQRFYAAQLPYAPEEIGFGPDQDDAVVIWSSLGVTSPFSGSERSGVVQVRSSMRAVIALEDRN